MKANPLPSTMSPLAQPHVLRNAVGDRLTAKDRAAGLRVCVERKGAWCATNREVVPFNVTGFQATNCGYYVLPWGYAIREPDCTDCCGALQQAKERRPPRAT